FALHSLGEALRREIGPKGIRVCVIEPAVVKSEFQNAAGYDPTVFGSFMEKIGPVLEPSDIAELIGSILSLPARVNIADVVIRPTRQDYP
ncbi:MAG: SDR family NAD(P)-dependent oxidoreductase, partial [Pyrinomonadaceae bacterium]|nr:SDR family NAD(P)-dependent oxidoreductase [Phycisphaerales bacterium]